MDLTPITDFIEPYLNLQLDDDFNLVYLADQLKQTIPNLNYPQTLDALNIMLEELADYSLDQFNTKITLDTFLKDHHIDINQVNFQNKKTLINYNDVECVQSKLVTNQEDFLIYIDSKEFNAQIITNPEKIKEAALISQALLALNAIYWGEVYNSESIDDFAKLVYYQNQQLDDHQDLQKSLNTEEAIKDPDIRKFVETLVDDIGDDNSHHTPHLSAYEIAELLNNLRHNKDLTLTQTEWLLKENQMDVPFINDFITEYHIERHLKAINYVPEPIKELYQELSTKSIVDIYAVNPSNNQQPATGNKVFWGIHGTKSFSVPSIVAHGLLSSRTLKQQKNQDFSYTGSGLGEGIYFARLNQFQKALNYTYSNHGRQYCLIGKVNYQHAIHTNLYSGNDTDKCQPGDLIVGDGVGSHNRDEIVAPFDQQVQTKYLLVLTPK